MHERTVSQAVVSKKVFAVTPQSSTYEAARIMAKAKCGSVLVLDSLGDMCGIFTERDLMAKVVATGRNPVTTPVEDVMTPNPQVVRPETSVSDAVLVMKECGFRHLPVVSRASGIIGVFSLRDAMPHEIMAAEQLAEFLEDEFSNVLG